jgi:hypothetical protein
LEVGDEWDPYWQDQSQTSVYKSAA